MWMEGWGGLPWLQPLGRANTATSRLVPGPCGAAARRPAVNGTSAGKRGHPRAHQPRRPTTLATEGEGRPTAELRRSSWYGGHEKTCVELRISARSAQRVFPCMGNQERSFWAETKDKRLKSIHRSLCAPEHVCAYELMSETKRKAACVYAHPSPSPKTSPRIFFSRQVFHELQ